MKMTADTGRWLQDTPRLREPLRVGLLVLFLAVFALWMSLDYVSNEGFAPGVRDSSYVTSGELIMDGCTRCTFTLR